MRGVLAPTPSARTCRRAALIAFAFAALLASPAMAAEPKPTSQRFIPARELIAYVEFDGLAAHADAWHATAAHAMLAKTPAGDMMTEVARQLADRFLKMVPGGKLTGADLLALQDHLVHHGFAVSLHRHRDDVYSWTIVLNRIGHKGTRERFDRLIEPVSAPTPAAPLPKPTRLRGRDVYQVVRRAAATPAGLADFGAPAAEPAPPAPASPWLSWWFEADDLIVTCVRSTTFEFAAHRQSEAAHGTPRGPPDGHPRRHRREAAGCHDPPGLQGRGDRGRRHQGVRIRRPVLHRPRQGGRALRRPARESRCHRDSRRFPRRDTAGDRGGNPGPVVGRWSGPGARRPVRGRHGRRPVSSRTGRFIIRPPGHDGPADCTVRTAAGPGRQRGSRVAPRGRTVVGSRCDP